ncbi:MAG: CHAT domain-containing protein [Blastocatellia bacterium]|nr:CHAT domain-containing protein [Blastocatellia bacterium]
MTRFRSLLAALLCVFGFSISPRATAQEPRLDQLLDTCQRQISNERYELAYRTAAEALSLSRKRADRRGEARATNLLAVAAFHTNRTNEAIRYFKQASATADDAGILTIQARALARAGALLRLSGRYEDALFCVNEALRLYRRFRAPVGEVLMLSQLGAIYADTADFAKAAQLLQDALALAKRLSDPEPQAAILARLFVVEKGRGDLGAALEYGRQAEALFARLAPSLRTVELFYQLGTAHVALGQPQQALPRFEQALRIARELRAPQFAGVILGGLADVQLASGNASAALDSATMAISTLQQGGGSRHLETGFLATRAEAQRLLGRSAEALASYREALAALEQARALSIPTEISRAGIVATRHQVFAGAIELMHSLSQPAEAFDVAEAYHARAFLDVLAESGIESPGELGPAQQAQEDRLFENISNIQRQLWQTDLPAGEESRLNRQLAQAENALDLFRLEQRRADPRYNRINPPQLLTHGRIAADLLDAETALIEYVLGDKRSYAWVVFRGRIASVILPSAAELAADVAACRAASFTRVSSATAAQAIVKLRGQSRRLYQKLFQPLEPHLAGARKLIIVPDGPLSYLPFEMLAGDPKRAASTAPYLVERFSMSYAPSASALAALRSMRQHAAEAKGVIAFGDPVYEKNETLDGASAGTADRGPELRRLPYTRTEVNEIAALFPVAERRVFLGAEANEANVKREPLQQYRYVHFATHALVDEARPARSRIVLSLPADAREDGALQMSEVMRLKLQADLVALSACRTGLGQLLKGEGMIGLTRAFLYAGAESVAVSLWDVNDIATAALMKAFYKNLQQGLQKDDALRQAKLALIRGPQLAWRHPYYWASFVLVGDTE